MYETLIEYAPQMMMAVLGGTAVFFGIFFAGMAKCCIQKHMGKCPAEGCDC